MPLEVDRRQHSGLGVLAPRVLEHLYVVEYILPGFFARSVGPVPDPLALQQLE